MENKVKRTYIGTVISDKMDKTVVVKTDRTFVQKEFSKTMKSSKKYKVDDPQGIASVGDIVEFYEVSPISKTKYMRLKQIIKPAAKE